MGQESEATLVSLLVWEEGSVLALPKRGKVRASLRKSWVPFTTPIYDPRYSLSVAPDIYWRYQISDWRFFHVCSRITSWWKERTQQVRTDFFVGTRNCQKYVDQRVRSIEMCPKKTVLCLHAASPRSPSTDSCLNTLSYIKDDEDVHIQRHLLGATASRFCSLFASRLHDVESVDHESCSCNVCYTFVSPFLLGIGLEDRQIRNQ